MYRSASSPNIRSLVGHNGSNKSATISDTDSEHGRKCPRLYTDSETGRKCPRFRTPILSMVRSVLDFGHRF